MFEKLIRELENLDGTLVNIPIEPDEDGYLDKECPSDECLFVFKVYEEDWANLLRDNVAYCPMCGHESHDDSW